jgi:hypothetical protein
MKDILINIYNWIVIGLVAYISGWLMFIKPLIDIIGCDSVTGLMVVGVILKIVFALPVGRLLYALGLAIALKIFQ